MNTLRRFLRTVAASAFQPESYRAHLKERTATGLGYLYWLMVLLCTVTSIFLALVYIPTRGAIQTFVDSTEPQLRAAYPAELVLTLQSGSLSTNVDEPYVIDPLFWEQLQEQSDEPVPLHFITIDTGGSLDDFDSYNTVILLTDTHFVGATDDGELRAFSFAEMEMDESLIVNREMYDEVMETFMPILRSVPAWIDAGVIVGLLLLPFVGAGVSWAGHLFILLFWTLLVWVISAIMGKGLSYWQLYRLSLYGVTLPLLYTTLVGWMPMLNMPFIPTMIFLIFMTVVLTKIPSPTMPAPKAPRKAVKAPRKASARRKKTKPLA